MSALAPFVQILGRGPGRARSLTRSEAHAAMTAMLTRDAAPEAVGAILMLMRMRGETAAEIAGFAEAAQAQMPKFDLGVDLDWPSYAAGRSRGAPWFLLSAKLLAQSGVRVLLHGWNGADPAVRRGVADLGITCSAEAAELSAALARDAIAYLPLERAAPAVFNLLALREVLGLRSCMNTVCRMLNPGHAATSVQGVFHPSYRLLQADAAVLLGWSGLRVIKGGGGEFEVNPSKASAVFGLRAGAPETASLPARRGSAMRLADGPATRDLAGLWSGAVTDAFATDVVIATAGLALDALGTPDAAAQAVALWQGRNRARKSAA